MNPPDSQSHVLRVQSLFIQHQNQLRGFLHSLVPDFAMVDDLIQECFLTVTQKALEFDLTTNFQAWIRSIARFKVMALQRDHSRRPQMLAAEVLDALMVSAPEPLPQEHDDAAVKTLRSCLERLAPAAREIVRLRYFSEYGPLEISRIRECSANAVNVTLARSRDVLRRCMESRMSEV
jgi:RNA polymerase sigma-70 factor (ECF subfamily)